MQFKIPIESESNRFFEYLNDDDNQRIIFSGIFGIGKTYFLKEFFLEKRREFFPIHLSPVNYSISSTEDIFRIMKYDILYEIFVHHNTDIIIEKIDKRIAVEMAMQEVNVVSIAQNIFKWFTLLNKESNEDDVSTIVALSSDIYEKAKSKDNPFSLLWKLSDDANRNEEALSFIKSIVSQFHLEEDFITEYISEKIQQNINSENYTKSVLIIDDLDRLDPEHIFRLFNIFSTHMNYRKEGRNKFGFDKIIFVCDIDNIKNIFQSKYGINTDFNGYIDKFFSKDIYYYINNKNMSFEIYNILDSINFKPNYKSHAFDTLIKESPLYSTRSNIGILHYALTQLARNGLISMRRIIAVYGKTFIIKKRAFSLPNRKPVFNTDILGLVALEILTWIAGDVDNLENMLEKNRYIRRQEDELSIESDQIDRTGPYLSQYFLPILCYSKINLLPQYMLQDYNAPTGSYEFDLNDDTKCRIDYSIYKYPGLLDNRNYTDTIGYFYKINNTQDMPRHMIDEIVYKSFKIMKDYLKEETRQSYFI